jgi:hypothetical protein
MSTYLPKNIDRKRRQGILEEALAGIMFLTERDLISLVGGDVHLCSDEDLATARADLRSMGYEERPIALWGRRPSFWRFEKVAFSPAEIASGHRGG